MIFISGDFLHQIVSDFLGVCTAILGTKGIRLAKNFYLNQLIQWRSSMPIKTRFFWRVIGSLLFLPAWPATRQFWNGLNLFPENIHFRIWIYSVVHQPIACSFPAVPCWRFQVIGRPRSSFQLFAQSLRTVARWFRYPIFHLVIIFFN